MDPPTHGHVGRGMMSVFRYRDLLVSFFWRLWWAVFCDLSFSKFHHYTLLKGIMVTNRLRIKASSLTESITYILIVLVFNF